ncbi:MAG: histidine phosphatase family protein [Gammaproteobacteria bacterium]|nr:histidine phosphatase family protein [Gammaproteobacteria bacterium]
MHDAQRTLVLMRHAKSDWDSASEIDFDRPLSARGRRDAPRVGGWLVRAGLVPDLVVSSPAARARATTLAVLAMLPEPKPQVLWEPLVYAASLATLLAVLGKMPDSAQRVLLVGHNPGLEELLRYLSGGALPADVEPAKPMPTAAVACLHMPAHWQRLSAGTARCVRVMRPRKLAE